MSNEKISIQDLVDVIAKRTGYSKKKSDEFLRAFQNVLEEGLTKDGIVKIKGFGTFKLIWNEARKSVNVQTGQEYIIPGHNKVSFVPDASVKDTINESLSEGPVSASVVKTEMNPLEKLNEQAEEIKMLISELNEVVPEPSNEPLPLDAVTPPVSSVKTETPTKKVVVEEKPVVVESTVAEKPQASSVTGVQEHHAPDGYKLHERDIPVKKKHKLFIYSLICLFLLALAAAYLQRSSIKSFINAAITKERMADSTKVQKKKVISTKIQVREPKKDTVTDTIKTIEKKTAPAVEQPKTEPVSTPAPAATPVQQKVSTPAIAPVKAKVAAPEKPKAKVSIFDQPRVYNTFIGIDVIQKGSRLTLIAEKFYGHKNFWVYIYEANKSKISNPGSLPVGFTVKLPKLPAELIDVNNPDCIKYAGDLEKKYANK